jgi:hypothetical protein
VTNLRVAVLGAGAVGSRAARQLASTDDVHVLVHDERVGVADTVVASLGPPAEALPAGDPAAVARQAGVDVALLCLPAGAHGALASELVAAGIAVVSTSDAVPDVEALLALDGEAIAAVVPVVAGAGFSPGLSCLLATHGAAGFDRVDEIHVARAGTGGPACARQHHAALGGLALDRRDREWVRRPGGSGRELCWFPDPIGGRDCYRAELPDPLLLARVFSEAERITSRLAANRRDRLTSRLPMLRRPHPEGGPGGVRVELRGDRGGARHVVVYGAMDRPAVAAGAVAAVAAVAAGRRQVRRVGAGGLGEMVEPLPALLELARRGVKAAVFDGTT